MTSTDIDTILLWRGAEHLTPGTHGGRSPRRFSKQTLARLPPLSARRASSATGVRIAASTDATAFRLVCHIESLTPGCRLTSARATVTDHANTATAADAAATPLTGDVTRHEFDFHLPATGVRDLEIWLPHDGIVAVHELSLPPGAVLASAAPSPRPLWVHHGSSISHAGEVSDPAERWPVRVARRDNLQLCDLSIAGECHIDQFVARHIRDHPAHTISLELGVNVVNGATMTERTFRSAVHGFLDTVRDGHPQTPILIVSPIAFPTAEHRGGPTPFVDGRFMASGVSTSGGALSIERVRHVLGDIVTERVDEGDTALTSLSGDTLLSLDEADLLVDGLHPGAGGGALIAARFPPLGRRAADQPPMPKRKRSPK